MSRPHRRPALGKPAGPSRRRYLAAWAVLLAIQTARAEKAEHHPEPVATVLERRLSSDAVSDRVAAYAILARQEGSEGLLRLASLDRTKLAERSGREQLALVRALLPRAGHPQAAKLLFWLSAQLEAHNTPSDPWRGMALQMSLLGLAAARTPESFGYLVRSLGLDGSRGEAAGLALLAHPPRPWTRLLDNSVPRSANWATVMGRLGNREAIGPLEALVVHGTPEQRLAAARALIELSDPAILAVLRHWHDDPGAAPELRELWHARQAQPNPSPRRWLHRLVDPQSVGPAVEALAEAATFIREPIVLEASRSAGLRSTSLRVLALRALTDQALTRAELGVAEKGLSSTRPSERWAAAVSITRSDPSRWYELLRSTDANIRNGATVVLPLAPLPEAVLDWVVPRLVGSRSDRDRERLCGALVHPNLADRIPLEALLNWAQGSSACAPAAGLALGTRDTPSLRPVLRTLLTASHPLLRAAVAIGLGRSREPSVVGWLREHYEQEPDPRVRLALIDALSRHDHPSARDALALASLFDPHALVRQRAKNGRQRLACPDFSHDPFGLLCLEDPGAPRSSGPGRRRPRLMRLEVEDLPQGQGDRLMLIVGLQGLALPTFADPEGILLSPAAGTEGIGIVPWTGD